MKKLVLILNDVPEVGKSSFARVFEQFMTRRKIEFLSVSTARDESGSSDALEFGGRVGGRALISFLDHSDVTVIDVGTGDGGTLAEFFNEEEVFELLLEMEAELTS